jgi:hypothetical protein
LQYTNLKIMRNNITELKKWLQTKSFFYLE